jgi:hypothetical protein
VAIYPDLTLVTDDESVAEALIQPATGRLRPGQTNEIGSEDPVARLLFEGREEQDGPVPDAYRFALEVRTEPGMETFAAWLVAKLADRTVMLRLDDDGVETREAAIVEWLEDRWRAD